MLASSLYLLYLIIKLSPTPLFYAAWQQFSEFSNDFSLSNDQKKSESKKAKEPFFLIRLDSDFLETDTTFISRRLPPWRIKETTWRWPTFTTSAPFTCTINSGQTAVTSKLVYASVAEIWLSKISVPLWGNLRSVALPSKPRRPGQQTPGIVRRGMLGLEQTPRSGSQLEINREIIFSFLTQLHQYWYLNPNKLIPSYPFVSYYMTHKLT